MNAPIVSPPSIDASIIIGVIADDLVAEAPLPVGCACNVPNDVTVVLAAVAVRLFHTAPATAGVGKGPAPPVVYVRI
jgi:hypothetical protein